VDRRSLSKSVCSSVVATRIVATILITFTVVFGAVRASCSATATADDTARFLAGLQPSPNSPLAALTKDPAWVSHARYFDSLFAREENTHLSKIREFSQKYLTDKHGTMLYMFSGPDFLYATSFFPTASTYVLAGLEPVGRIPELANLSPFVINGELANLESALGSLFNFSFFITQNMKSQLREGPIFGTLPILYVFLARTGKTVHEINFVNLDEQGDPQVTGQVASPTRGAAPGVKIVFSEGDGPKQTLYYFSTNLADGSFERSGFSAFLAKLGPADSLLKSASYLLHKTEFAKVRRLLLDNSETIVQDDSGIPLAYFAPRRWRFLAFGRYEGPISMFANFYQPRMAEQFQSANPIDFGIGYRWRKNESNLVVAQKQPLPNGEVGLTSQSQAEGDVGGTAAGPNKKVRKRTETQATRPLGCGFGRVFPFCW
jgi:hypothetical protein